MTFTPQIIDNTAPGESLRSGATKINTNFEAIEEEFNGIDIETIPDQLEMLYTPTNYTPDIAPSATLEEHLASHLKGIDAALAALELRIAALE